MIVSWKRESTQAAVLIILWLHGLLQAGEKWSAEFVGVIMTFAALPRTSVAEEKLLCSYFL